MNIHQADTVGFVRAVRGAAMALAFLSLAACGGNGDSGTATATVQVAPAITAGPASLSVTAPATATFSITATGTPAPTYQWSVNGVAIPGATGASYTTPATTAALSGTSYTVAVTNSAGAVISAPAATLTVATTTAAAPAIGWDGVNHTQSGFNYTQGTYLIGFSFKANRAITVDHLGAYDSSLGSMANGAQTFQATPVGLYDLTTHTLLGTVTVHGSDTAIKVYRYAALTTPVSLNTTDTYAVVWATGTNHYVATQLSAIIVPADVNSAVNFVAFAGYGPGGLTQTNVIAEPNFFVPSALNYDIGPNFTLQ
jgi:hypothetical protein